MNRETSILDEYDDETVAVMPGLPRYVSGLPMNRIEKLQSGFGISLPVSTQWEILLDAGDLLGQVSGWKG